MNMISGRSFHVFFYIVVPKSHSVVGKKCLFIVFDHQTLAKIWYEEMLEFQRVSIFWKDAISFLYAQGLCWYVVCIWGGIASYLCQPHIPCLCLSCWIWFPDSSTQCFKIFTFYLLWKSEYQKSKEHLTLEKPECKLLVKWGKHSFIVSSEAGNDIHREKNGLLAGCSQ